MLSSSVIRRSLICLRGGSSSLSLPSSSSSSLRYALGGNDVFRLLLEEKNNNVLMVAPQTSCQTVRFMSTGSDSSSSNSSDSSDSSNLDESGEGENAKAGNGDDSSGQAAGESTREEELEKEVKDLKDQLLRALAEAENTRRIAQRDVSSARNFAVTSFAKSLLETSDNLTRAMEAVPEEYRSDTENHPVLATLYEGIQMTDSNLTKAFAKHGLAKFGVVGEPFDPNKHEALFEYPDPNQTPGSVGQVMKVGYTLNERVIRSAEVGVIKKT